MHFHIFFVLFHSRFDIIFVLKDDCNQIWDEKITKHVMNIETRLDASKYWSTDHLKMHFLAARDTRSVLSDSALEILIAYFRKLAGNLKHNTTSRITARCLDSLTRLTLSYSKLLLKSIATALDAVTIIRLVMENIYEMGTIVFPFDVLKKDLPLGPTKQEIIEILYAIGLPGMIDQVLAELKIATGGRIEVNPPLNVNQQSSSQSSIVDLTSCNDRLTDSNFYVSTKLFQVSPQQTMTSLILNKKPVCKNGRESQNSKVNLKHFDEESTNDLIDEVVKQHNHTHIKNEIKLSRGDTTLLEMLESSEIEFNTEKQRTLNICKNSQKTENSIIPTSINISNLVNEDAFTRSLVKLHDDFAFSQVQKRAFKNDEGQSDILLSLNHEAIKRTNNIFKSVASVSTSNGEPSSVHIDDLLNKCAFNENNLAKE